ncbi:MAG: MjaI family restriction endonuclease [Atribacterota bacterium]
MAKEWILNIATNRWGLNKKDIVGPVSLWIRECAPKTINDWESFYYKKVTEMLKQKAINLSPQEYIQDLGRKLYMKITEVIQAEIEEVTEESCIQYIHNLVISRTFDGYQTEIKTIYGQLQQILKVPIQPASDKWDRLYNVDFYIGINGKYIGLQIKPITYEQTPEIYRWKRMAR